MSVDVLPFAVLTVYAPDPSGPEAAGRLSHREWQAATLREAAEEVRGAVREAGTTTETRVRFVRVDEEQVRVWVWVRPETRPFD